jgi:D-glycero-D-manno-heptose 1,7-bisphosphate phosphatase
VSSTLRPAVFLDRDGTLTVETDWIVRPDLVTLLPRAAEAVARLERAGFTTVIVTNQSAVARGMIDEAMLATIHARLRSLLAAGGARLDAIYHCPHHPTEGVGLYRTECECRKPKPGLLARAAADLNLDLARSWMIGDAERDVVAAEVLGVRPILVATGKGREEFAKLAVREHTLPRYVPDVGAAADLILASTRA